MEVGFVCQSVQLIRTISVKCGTGRFTKRCSTNVIHVLTKLMDRVFDLELKWNFINYFRSSRWHKTFMCDLNMDFIY